MHSKTESSERLIRHFQNLVWCYLVKQKLFISFYHFLHIRYLIYLWSIPYCAFEYHVYSELVYNQIENLIPYWCLSCSISTTLMTTNNRLIMNERNGEIQEPLIEEDADNLPHNLARFARTSYSKKVSQESRITGQCARILVAGISIWSAYITNF